MLILLIFCGALFLCKKEFSAKDRDKLRIINEVPNNLLRIVDKRQDYLLGTFARGGSAVQCILP
jgi:hypothetical protein